MQKPEKYDWKDSNVSLIGSNTDRDLKKNSAETEIVWKKAMQCAYSTIFIWRIEKFKVVEWPKEQYGVFYEGDSYIILNVKENENHLLYNLHFWIGKYSTQDEYGTAVYKTVELDTLLDDRAVQHREVQHYESDLFKSYFKDLIYLKGGCESGFRIVNTQNYIPRLLHVRGRKHSITVSEVSATRKNLHSDDVFIYDTGLNIFQWIGKGANKDEKFKARQFVQQLNSDRNGKCIIEVIDEEGLPENHEFYSTLSDTQPNEDEKQISALISQEKQLFRISDASGSLNFEKAVFDKSNINENDVFIIDNGQIIFVYIGENSSPNERKKALIYAHMYLKRTLYPQVPVTVINSKVYDDNAKLFNSVFEN